jgi:hypothetical protein
MSGVEAAPVRGLIVGQHSLQFSMKMRQHEHLNSRQQEQHQLSVGRLCGGVAGGDQSAYSNNLYNISGGAYQPSGGHGHHLSHLRGLTPAGLCSA